MMRTCARLAAATTLAVLAAAPAPAVAQQQPPPPPARPLQAPRDIRPEAEAQATGTAAISGAVVVAGSGQPARRARVMLNSAEARVSRFAETDDQGVFAFAGLPAGRYLVSASKTGHVSVSYGQRRPGRAGTAIQLVDGQKVQIRLQMPRGGVISGAVLDERGEALPGTQIRVLRYSSATGERTLQQAGTGSTDDRGIYRVYGLQPGDYVVCAVPRNTNMAVNAMERLVEIRAQITELQAQSDPESRARAQTMAAMLPSLQAEASTANRPVNGYAPVYFPGTTSSASATSLTVGPGEERLGVDFQLQLVPMSRIEGMVAMPAAQNLMQVQVSLVNVGDGVNGLGDSNTRTDRNGHFTIANVPPGQYTVHARAAAGPPAPAPGALRVARPEQVRYWATADVSVDGQTTPNVLLALQPGISVSGRLEFEGRAQIPIDLTRARVSLMPVRTGVEGDVGPPGQGRVDASGRFTVSNVVPGRYRLSGSAAAPEWTLRSATVGGQDAIDGAIEIKGNEDVSGAVITFSDQQTELTGVITNAQGQPVADYSLIVYAADSKYWVPMSRRVRSIRPDTDGQFKITNLPPGEYRIGTLLDPEPGSWYDPAFLQQLDGTAMRITLGEGDKKVQNIQLSGGL
jgi:carboxypeptidase family protein